MMRSTSAFEPPRLVEVVPILDGLGHAVVVVLRDAHPRCSRRQADRASRARSPRRCRPEALVAVTSRRATGAPGRSRTRGRSPPRTAAASGVVRLIIMELAVLVVL